MGIPPERIPPLNAFPANDQPGMTLRDYFAAAALTGLRGTPRGGEESSVLLAEISFGDADAMLAERTRNAEGTP